MFDKNLGMKWLFLFLLAATALRAQEKTGNFKCENGVIRFRSEAPLETIEAKSIKLRGLVNVTDRTFAWVLRVNTFEGFNSGLQGDHFKENYLETDRYPTAIFQGKIIEEADFSTPQKITLRAKGKLTIHGIEQERIIKVTLDIQPQSISVQSHFSVLLSDHNINIPRIVHQKIAEEVQVIVEARLIPD